MKTKNVFFTAVAVGVFTVSLLGLSSTSCKAAPELSAEASVGIYSSYIWRGYELSKDSLVIQPSASIGYNGFGFNLWGNLDTDQSTDLFSEDGNKWNETDMTLSYEGSYDMINYSAGYIYYALEGLNDTQEIYASIGLDLPASPTLTVYRDIDAAPGWYIALDISQAIDLGEKLSLGLGAKVSYLVVDDETTLADPSDPTSEYSDFHDAVFSVSLGYAMTDNITITPELYYSFALGSDAQDVMENASADGNDSDFFYGGVSASFSF